jgi:hypothetical protein
MRCPLRAFSLPAGSRGLKTYPYASSGRGTLYSGSAYPEQAEEHSEGGTWQEDASQED